jgi:5'-nucleotidase
VLFVVASMGFTALGSVGSSSSNVGAATTSTIQVLGINDFHGRIGANGIEAGAAVLGGAVDQLRAQYPNTVFAAAGDLIGASTFESFIQQDKPTIDALNAAGLEVSAVGNHEFDQGYADLVDRVMAPYDPVTNPRGGALWAYIGANVRNALDNSPALPESWIQDFGDIRVGFVGAVTDHLAELVSPAGIAGLNIEPPVVAANRTADELKAAGADIVILLVHEGAATTALASAVDPASDFGEIVLGANPNIDAIVSGHTHLSYSHLIPVQAWVDEGRPVTVRPVVSAGQYGYNLNQILFEVDDDTDDVVGVTSAIVPLTTTTPQPPPAPAIITPNYPADPTITPIVAAAVADAAVLGSVELGRITAPFTRGKLANGTTENRGAESTVGNLVAEVQRWATETPTSGGAQIAMMNPGGLRADMLGNAGTPAVYPAVLTYRQAANTQPFANTLVNMSLTGAQIKTALEQQWQPAGAQRPFLRLGLSEGLTYTYDPTAAAGSRITQIWLNGTPIDPAGSYSVTVNSFLAAGGDNFTVFAQGTNRRDTGKIDLQAMVDYMATFSPVAPDYTQRSVGVVFPAGAPATYQAGETVTFNLTSLAMTNVADVKDTELAVSLAGAPVGTAAVTNVIGTDVFDENGTATVTFVVPAGTPGGVQSVTLVGNNTGTTTSVPITVFVPKIVTTTTITASRTQQTYEWPFPVRVTATVAAADGLAVSGSVEFSSGATVLGTVAITNGKAQLTLPESFPVGSNAVTATYLGTDTLAGSVSTPVNVLVVKAPSLTILTASSSSQRRNTSNPVKLTAYVSVPFVGRAAGSIEFKSGTTVVATVPVASGKATYTLPGTLPVGTYSYTATFVPTDSANIAGSRSNTVRITVRR